MSTAPEIEEIDYGYELLGSLRKDLRMLQGFSTVVQELIQNAEDAGADTFWMDFTADALRVGNNKVFEDEHFSHIVRVASGSKRDDADAIGSFGVGFVSVYQLTDEPQIYSRNQARILRPLNGKALKLSPVDHEWPSTFILPWATQPSVLRRELEVEPVDLGQMETFISETQETFRRSAVFLKHIRTLHLLRDGQPVDRLTIETPSPNEVSLSSMSGQVVTYRMYDVPLTEEMRREAARRRRRTTLQLALPLGGEDVDGLLYAFLPTRDKTGVPLHINADFYPNTDRKTLLWDEPDKRQWNEKLLGYVVNFLPSLLLDLRTDSPEALYTFADEVRRAASRTPGSPHPVSQFVNQLWGACQLTFQRQALFWSRTGAWVPREQFLHIPHTADPLLEEAIVQQVGWQLSPPEHSGYRALFRALAVPELDGKVFIKVLEELFEEKPDWLPQRQRQPMLDAVFGYFAQLNEHQKLWRQAVEGLSERLDKLHLARAADGELVPLDEVWTCPEEYLRAADPWLSDDVLVDKGWWMAAPQVLRERVNPYTPEDFAQVLAGATNIAELVQSGWPIQRAYAFLSTDPRLGGQVLRKLPIYRTTSGNYSAATELAIPDQINDPFQVRKLIDLDSLKGYDSLLGKLALDRLDAGTYYGRLLPAFFRQHPQRRREVIEAISEVYSRSDFPLGEWRPLPCAELTTGEWVQPERAYWPNELLTALFGDDYPQFAADRYKGRRGVRPLMEELGMRLSISEKDVISVLDQRGQEAVTETAVNLRQKILDHALQAPTSVLSTYLAKLKWVPARESRGWHSPSELLLPDDLELVGQRLGSKRASALRTPDRQQVKTENLRALGFAHPEPEQVVQHIGDLNNRGQGPSGRILRWLNRNVDRIPGTMRRRLRELKIFPLTGGQFAAATRLFREEPNLGLWRHRVGPDELERLTPLLNALSVPDVPQPLHHRDVLLEIAGEYASGETPPKDAQDVAEHCFKALSDAFSKDRERMQEIMTSLRGKRVVPVFWKERSGGSLLRPEDALLLDKPIAELRRFGLPERIDVRARDIGTPGFVEELGVRTVSSVWRVTYELPTGALRPMPEQNRRLRQMIPALLRLALKVHRRTPVNDLRDRLLQFQFFRCHTIPTTVELRGFKILGHCELNYAVDAEAGRLYVRDLNQEYTVNVLAEMLALSDSSDQATLDAIWSRSLEDAEAYLTRFNFLDLPEEYVPVEITSAVTASIDDVPEQEADSIRDEEDGSPQPQEVVQPREAASSVDGKGHRPTEDRRPAAAPIQSGAPQTPPPSGDAPTSPTAMLPSNSSHPPLQPQAAGPRVEQPSPRGEQSSSGRRSAFSPSRQQRFRNYTYVYEGPEENEVENHAREVDRRGMEYVMAHEWQRGHRPEDVSNDYGAGYDILSVDRDGVVRYIELKTMSGPWGTRGVALSANQYNMARSQKGHYWLYVIENLDGEPALHEIQNPFERVTSYTFDESWKQSPSSEEELSLG